MGIVITGIRSYWMLNHMVYLYIPCVVTSCLLTYALSTMLELHSSTWDSRVLSGQQLPCTGHEGGEMDHLYTCCVQCACHNLTAKPRLFESLDFINGCIKNPTLLKGSPTCSWQNFGLPAPVSGSHSHFGIATGCDNLFCSKNTLPP